MRPILKLTLFLICCSLWCTGCSHRVLLEGTAVANRNQRVAITVNDTFRKISNTEFKSVSRSRIYRMMGNSKFAATTDFNNRYRIRPKKSDTLYFSASGHATQAYAVTDIHGQKYKYVQLEKKPPCDTSKCDTVLLNRHILIAKKVKLNFIVNNCPNRIKLSPEYNANYTVVEDILGNYDSGTIKFRVIEPLRKPAYESEENVLLLLDEHCGELRHSGNNRINVYKATNGRWALPYYPLNFINKEHGELLQGHEPQLITFASPVAFPIKDISSEMVAKLYPSPYYRIEGNTAIALYGNYVDDLKVLRKR
ncbi:MAG: hypothetical protein EOO45_15620 [Flavobacterium sp.]|nr:MAG: hypothetical protein EOO45_15620 [Flavobacterium sp.]